MTFRSTGAFNLQDQGASWTAWPWRWRHFNLSKLQ